MKPSILVLLSLFLADCSTFAAQSNKRHTPNFFSPKKDSINFSFLSPTPFSYEVSSCFNANLCAHNLFDSNSHTQWKTEATDKDEWLLVDFGKKRLMNQLYIELTKNSNIRTFQIQVLKREKWFALHKEQNPKQRQQIKFGNIDATLLRVYFRKKRKGAIHINNLKVQLNAANLTGVNKNLTGYRYPIPNALFPKVAYSLPGAPRAYRNGTHKGIDIIYKKDASKGQKALSMQDPIVAIADGIIVRADHKYVPMTPESYQDAIDYTKNHRVTFVDKDFGGRQIWIDHQNGVMSSYNHMSSIAKSIRIGTKVRKGQKIGTVGNSGLRAEAEKSNKSIHLHLEIWVNGEFLGKGLDAKQSRKLLQYFFTE